MINFKHLLTSGLDLLSVKLEAVPASFADETTLISEERSKEELDRMGFMILLLKKHKRSPALAALLRRAVYISLSTITIQLHP